MQYTNTSLLFDLFILTSNVLTAANNQQLSGLYTDIEKTIFNIPKVIQVKLKIK